MSRDARFIGPVERLLYLRTLPAFDKLPPGELAAIAHSARERFFKKGSQLLAEGQPANSVFFLVEGRVTTRRRGRVVQTIDAPFAVGFLPVLSRNPDGIEARAEIDTLTLEMPADELVDAMEENFALLETAVRQLSKQLAELQRSLELEGKLKRDEPVDTPYPEAELDLVERLAILRRSGPYRAASLDSLAELAKHAREVRLSPGDVLWQDGEPSGYGVTIIHGTMECVGDEGGRRFLMGPGSVIGHMESFARMPRSYAAIAKTRVVGLRGDTDAFFDVLEDNFDLGLAFVGFLAGVLAALYERAAMARQGPEARAS